MCREMDEIYNEGAKRGRDEGIAQGIEFGEMKKAKENKDKFYNDYDCTNKELIEKYNIKIIDKIKKYMSCIEEKPKYLKIDKVNKFIEDMANLNLEEQEKTIKEYGTK